MVTFSWARLGNMECYALEFIVSVIRALLVMAERRQLQPVDILQLLIHLPVEVAKDTSLPTLRETSHLFPRTWFLS